MSIVFSNDSNWLYSAARDGSIYRWNVETGELDLVYDDGSGVYQNLMLTSDGRHLITGAENTTIRDVETGEIIQIIEAGIGTNLITGSVMSLNVDETQLALYVMDEGIVKIIDMTSGEEHSRFPAFPAGTWAQITYDHQGENIIAAGNAQVIVWDVPDTATDTLAWVQENRFTPDFSCEQRLLYQIEPLCKD